MIFVIKLFLFVALNVKLVSENEEKVWTDFKICIFVEILF